MELSVLHSDQTIGAQPWGRDYLRPQGGTVLALCRISVRYGYSILIFVVGLAAESVHAQVVIEGTVQLPKPSFDRGFNQRYAASSDIPLAPSNPPAAVVYL